jgi:hypothetical protein
MIWTHLACPDRTNFGDHDIGRVRIQFPSLIKPKEIEMAKGQQRGNRELKKPKKEKIKAIAAAPSRKAAAWQPAFASDKKK